MGRATALLAAREGANVVCLDVTDPQDVADEIGSAARAVTGDIRHMETWARAVDVATSELGSLDFLANIAGVMSAPGEDTVLDQTEDGWERIVGVNLTGTWLGMQAVLPAMIECGGGSIVNVASVAALRGLPMLAAYAASKAGILGLTRQAAVDYGRHGVRVNAIAPGDVDTPMSAVAPENVKAAMLRKTPVGRRGTPDDIARAIVFLFGPAADFVDGHVLVVDGGWSMRA